MDLLGDSGSRGGQFANNLHLFFRDSPSHESEIEVAGTVKRERERATEGSLLVKFEQQTKVSQSTRSRNLTLTGERVRDGIFDY